MAAEASAISSASPHRKDGTTVDGDSALRKVGAEKLKPERQ